MFDYVNQDAGEEVVALILPDTPTVLAMGIADIDKGWRFEWPAGSYSPFAVKPDGAMVWFVVRDYVIYFSKNQDAAFTNRVSSIVAAAKRRHTTKGASGGGGRAGWSRRCLWQLPEATATSRRCP